MLKITCRITGAAPISFSRPIQSEKSTGESHDAFEKRTWRERTHRTKDGEAFICPMALKNCLSEVAKYLQESVPGKGKSTYTRFFEAGVMVMDEMLLGVQADDIPGERLLVPSSGRRGDGTRVWKRFPVLQEWSTNATIYVLDPMLQDKPEKVAEYLGFAGKFIGMGRWRPRNNGLYGRFTVDRLKYETVDT